MLCIVVMMNPSDNLRTQLGKAALKQTRILVDDVLNKLKIIQNWPEIGFCGSFITFSIQARVNGKGIGSYVLMPRLVWISRRNVGAPNTQSIRILAQDRAAWRAAVKVQGVDIGMECWYSTKGSPKEGNTRHRKCWLHSNTVQPFKYPRVSRDSRLKIVSTQALSIVHTSPLFKTCFSIS
jgi:hypothetical protein